MASGAARRTPPRSPERRLVMRLTLRKVALAGEWGARSPAIGSFR
jgi:hypothetical protein